MSHSAVTEDLPPQTSRTILIGNDAHPPLHLRCPRCGLDLAGAVCPLCAFRLDSTDGIVRALPPERVAHYARFIVDYQRIRVAEGRGSQSEEFYCELPYKDLSGKNSTQWRIRALSYDHLLGHVLRPNVPPGGRILDLGAGNGWMSYRLALAGYSPVAVDLLTNHHDGLGAAAHYRRFLPALFPRFQAELACLPLQSQQFDAVIFNASFHYAENAATALCEALRCARPGGIVAISDTPWYSSDDSGRRMVAERHAMFLQRYGTASDSIRSVEYLTDERLRMLAERASISWEVHSPRYGLQWAMRPVVAKLRHRREPSRFRIYVARKSA